MTLHTLVLLASLLGCGSDAPPPAPEATPIPEKGEKGVVAPTLRRAGHLELPKGMRRRTLGIDLALPAASSAPIPDEDRGELVAWIGENLVVNVESWRRRWNGIVTSEGVALSLNRAVELSEELAEPLQRGMAQENPPNLALLEKHLYGFEPRLSGEGTGLVLRLAIPAWRELSARTQPKDDDAWIAMVQAGCSDAACLGYPKWRERTWDNGGCSTLGTGVHLKVLQKVDAARDAGAAFNDRALFLRQLVLEDIFTPTDNFPYCALLDGQKTPSGKKVTPEQALAEVQSILDEVGLMAAEEARLRKVLERGLGGSAP